DREALPVPGGAGYSTRAHSAPETPGERALAKIWRELLHVERVGRDDNFFELGGHSLLATALIERMRSAGLFTDVRALFLAPTLRELAAAATTDAREVERAAGTGIPEGTTRITADMLPLVSLSEAAIERVVSSVPGGAQNIQDIYPLA